MVSSFCFCMESHVMSVVKEIRWFLISNLGRLVSLPWRYGAPLSWLVLYGLLVAIVLASFVKNGVDINFNGHGLLLDRRLKFTILVNQSCLDPLFEPIFVSASFHQLDALIK